MARVLQIEEDDGGRTLRLRPGDGLEVSLPGNPSTGYNWSVKAMDPQVLALEQGPTFVSDDTRRIGSPGTVRLRFEALAPGRTRLMLAYRRSWEDSPPLRAFELGIIIGD